MRARKTYEAHGRSQTLADWSKESGVDQATIRKRLSDGWTVEDAVTRRLATVESQSSLQELWEGANELPYAEDVVAQVLLGRNGALDGAEVARCLGMDRSTLYEIERRALEKLRDGKARSILSGAEEMLFERIAAEQDREPVWPSTVEA